MSRADAWIMDPFGAQLGRWGGAPSGGVAPQWYDPIVAILTDGGATGYLWVKDLGIATAIGQPVSDWEDVTGAAIWEQPGVSSLRPILQAGGLVFDGIDDRLNAGAGLAALFTGSTWTMAVGWSAITAGVSRVYWGITDGSTSNLINPVTSTNRLGFVPAASLFASTAPSAASAAWYTRNGVNYTRRLNTLESTDTTAVYPVGLNNLTLGARRSPSASIFFQGTISWVILTSRALNTTERADISTLLSSNGYPI